MLERRHIVSSARLIAICTLLSRVTGMARDIALMQFFGASRVTDAFWFAFTIPNLFRRLFAEGAMAAVFVPAFSTALEKEGRQAAWQLLARTLALLATTLVAIVIVGEVAIAAAWPFAVGGGDAAEARRLLLSLTAIMLPFMISICVVALFSSILNCVGSFAPAALAPAILNIGMLIGLAGLAPLMSRSDPSVQIYGVAVSVVISGAAQVLLLWPALRRRGVEIRWKLDARDARVRRMLAMMAPVAIGQGVLLVGTFTDSAVCWVFAAPEDGRTFSFLGLTGEYPLEYGALSVIMVAQRLYQFPLGVLAISLAVAALPVLSRLAARSDWGEWSAELRSSLRLAVFMGLIAGAMMWVLAEPIVRLLFEYRKFGEEDTQRAARVLAFYGLGMWAFCAQHIVLRAFYSTSDVVTPLRLSGLLVPINLALSVALIWFENIREGAFGLSTAITASANVLLGLWLLRSRTDTPLVDRSVLSAIGRMLAATLAAAAAVWLTRAGVPVDELATGSSGLGSLAWRAADAGGSLLLGMLVYVGVAALLRLPEPAMVLARWRRH